MDASGAMLPTPVQTLPFSSSCSLPSSRFPSTSLASRSFEASSSCSSSGLIEIQYPTISQIIDSSTPFSFSSQPISFRATTSSSSTALEPKFDYLPGVSNSSLKSPTTSGKSLLHASVIVDIPKPLESLQSSSIPPFLSKTYEIVNDASLDRVISWTPAGQSFVVWDPVEFSRIVLPRHFKHGNFSSFLHQLNTYVGIIHSFPNLVLLHFFLCRCFFFCFICSFACSPIFVYSLITFFLSFSEFKHCQYSEDAAEDGCAI